MFCCVRQSTTSILQSEKEGRERFEQHKKATNTTTTTTTIIKAFQLPSWNHVRQWNGLHCFSKWTVTIHSLTKWTTSTDFSSLCYFAWLISTFWLMDNSSIPFSHMFIIWLLALSHMFIISLFAFSHMFIIILLVFFHTFFIFRSRSLEWREISWTDFAPNKRSKWGKSSFDHSCYVV